MGMAFGARWLWECRVQSWQLYGENVLRWRNGVRSVWPEQAGAGAKGEVGLNALKTTNFLLPAQHPLST